MPLVSDTIPNLVGGVSQQAENLRYSNTATAIENATLSPVSGMQKRQAAEWLGEAHDYGSTADLALDDNASVHWINRDTTEHYALTFDGDGLRAFDADTGQALQVIVPDEVNTYLTSDGAGGTTSDFQDSLRFVTVADTTFIANRNVTVAGSVDADFLPHHFAAFPQLAYDNNRGGAGVNDGNSVRYRSDAAITQSEFEYSNPTYPANTTRYAVVSAKGDANNGLHIYHDNSNNYTYPSNFQSQLQSNGNPTGVGNTYIIVETGKLEHRDRSLQDNIMRGLGLATTQSWETYSVASVLTSRHVATYKGADLLVNNVSTSDSPVRFSFATLQNQTYGPNGNKTTLFGRTISHDLRINNGRIEISDDNGSTYRALRVNDHSTAKLYSTDAVRPWSGVDADNTADIDFDNIDTAVTQTNARDSGVTATWPGGSASSTNQHLFASAFMPTASAQLSLLNDIVWILSHFAGNDTSTTSTPSYVTDVFVPSSVAPVDANGLTFTTVQQGSSSNQVATFQDLPALDTSSNAPVAGSIYEVGGTAQGDGRYYVIVFDDGSADARYIETYETPYVLDETTLPIKVRREFDQSGNPQFVASLHQYAPRVAGDVDTNALPSFAGEKINDVFVHAGRLGFLSGESVSLTSSTDFGTSANFFRATVTQLLDSDRIDLNASTGAVAKLSHAVPFANTLMLFSERAQFRFANTGAVTPATALIQQTGAHATSLDAKPQRIGSSIFAAVSDVSRTIVREFRADIDTEIIESDEVTTQVPTYVPTGVFKLAASAKKNVVFALSASDTNSVYVYNYYDNQRQRLQSAWSKWTFADDTRIISAEVIDEYLYLCCGLTVPDYVGSLEIANSLGTSFGTTSTRTYFVRVPLEEITEASGTSFPILLDFTATRAQTESVEGYRTGADSGATQQSAYSSLSTTNDVPFALGDGVDFSVIELPYKTSSTGIRLVTTDATGFGQSPPVITAFNVEVASSSSLTAFQQATAAFLAAPSQSTANALNAIAVDTDNTKLAVIGRFDGVFLTTDDQITNTINTSVLPNFKIGRAYTMLYEQSPIFYKPGDTNVGKTDSRLQLRYLTLTMDDTSSFDVEVTADGRQTRKYEYEAFRPGVANFVLGERRFATERFRFPVFSQNQKVKIVFKNDTALPSTLTSLEWQGFISPKAVPVR